jgi:hypothetical protein
MKPMDKIVLRLSPASREGMTRIVLSGFISTRLSARDVRRLWHAVGQLAEQTCVVLAVESPLSWFDTWTLRLGRGGPERLRIRFDPPRRLRSHRRGDA